MNLRELTQADLSKLAAANGIDVPRWREYRLMADEKPVDVRKDIDIAEMAVEALRWVWWMHPRFGLDGANVCDDGYKRFTRTDRDGNETVRWDLLHGRRRRAVKFEIKRMKWKLEQEIAQANRYAGRADVLCVRARIGGENWPLYRDQVAGQPWFIEKVDDPWEDTYCDVYARIAPPAAVPEAEGA